MHPSAMQFCENVSKSYGAQGSGLDVGGRNVNGSARQFWPDVNWTIIDKMETDIVDDVIQFDYSYTDGSFMLGSDNKFNIILCTEVLEHEDLWRNIIHNAYRDLNHDGLLVLTCAGPNRPAHSAIDGAELRPNEYYSNLDSKELCITLVGAGFKRGQVIHDFGQHDLYVIASKA